MRILRDGSGFVSYYYSYRVSSHKAARLEHIPGSIGVTEDVLKRNRMREFPLINNLWNATRDIQGACPSFTFRMLDHGHHQTRVVKITESPVVERKKILRRIFQIVLSRVLNPKETLSVAWGLAFPKLYRTKGTDRSTYRAIFASNSVKVEVAFQTTGGKQNQPVSFKKDPALTHLDARGKTKNEPIGAQGRKETLCFTKYSWVCKDVAKGDRLVVNWVR